MAVIHYQFEAIHPFDDGNGRTRRIINILYLVLEELLTLPVLCMSGYIINRKTDYHKLLRKVTEEEDWESWILFMLEAIEKKPEKPPQKIDALNHLLDETNEVSKAKLPERAYSKELIKVLFEQSYCKIKILVEKGYTLIQRYINFYPEKDLNK